MSVRRSRIPAGQNAAADPYLHYQEQQSNGVDAGGSTSGSYQTRVLNTEVTDTHGIGSLASNKITLPAGTYDCLAYAPCANGLAHKIRIYNVTDAAALLVGQAAYAATTGAITPAIVAGRFTLSGTKDIRIEHFVNASQITYGWGLHVTAGDVEVYADIRLWKIS